MAQSHYILHKVMTAAANYFAGQSLADIPSAQVYNGISKEARVAPCVICFCLGATSEDIQSGVWKASLTVQIRSDSEGDATAAQHHTRCDTIFNLIDDQFAPNMSALVDFGVQGVGMPSSVRFNLEDPFWVSEMDVDLICQGSDIV